MPVTARYGVGLYGVDLYGEALVPPVNETPSAVLESLEVYAEITKPDGRKFRFDADGDAEDIPTGLQFSTKRGDGFSSGSFTLHRRIDQDHPDIEIRDEVAFFSGSGDTVFEGRVSAAPMSLDDDGHSIDIQVTGWMASAKDRKFQDIYVDRDASAWKEPALARKTTIATAGWGQQKVSATGGGGGLSWTLANESHAIVETQELHYDAGESGRVAKVQYKGSRAGTGWTSFVNPTLYVDDAPTLPSAQNVSLTLDSTVREATVTTPERYAMLEARVATPPVTPTAGSIQKYDQLAVYGHSDSEIPTHVISGEPDGLYVSDMMEHIISSYCPKLTWAGDDSTYPVPHQVFRDLIFPYDALLDLNKYHLRDLACWENRTVYWSSVDLTGYDWEVRLDDPGFKVTLEGDSDEGGGFNGIVVMYTDLLTGEQKILWPDEHTELQDTDELNPANRHGDLHWDDVTLTNPTLQDAALQLGRAILAERNQPKSPGQYTIVGYARDRQGNWQPAHKMRSGQRIIIPDHPNRRPRLITETSYSGDSHALTLSTDSAIQRVDAYQDRLATALAAANLN